MKSQAYQMAMLFDFYGNLLTERQRDFFDLYYNEDLSLAEIAENSGITRQGVRDVIVRAEGILTDTEEKLGIVRRFQEMRSKIAEIESLASEILTLNRRQYDNERLDQLAEKIRAAAEELKE